MNRRQFMLTAVTAMGGAFLGSPSYRVLAGEAPLPEASREVLTVTQKQMVSVLAEMIIPSTDTPGAVQAGVPAFIEMMVADWYTDTEREIFFEGLSALDRYCSDNGGGDFLEANAERQVAALTDAERIAADYKSTVEGALGGVAIKEVDEHTPFFAKIKELTVIGYFHSEPGATRELIYEPMPMRFDGDFDYATHGRQWSH